MAATFFFKFSLAILAGANLVASLWTCNGISATRRTVGYYDTNYAGTECGQYPETLIAAGYTHINAAYAWIDPDDFTVAFMTDTDDEIWRRTVALKQTNPGLQVWLSIGGWLMNSQLELTAMTFERLVGGNTVERNDRLKRFSDSLLSVLEEYGFDGVDIDWAYPTGMYSDFLYNLKLILEATGYGYGLSCTLPLNAFLQTQFDIDRMQHAVDWFNVMTYDIDNNTMSGTKLRAHSNLTEFEPALSKLWDLSVDPAKVTLGLGFYGRSYSILDAMHCPRGGCVPTGLSPPGVCDDSPGYLSYDQVQSVISDPATKILYDEDAVVKFAIYDNARQWVFYDDAETFRAKVEWASARCIGGLNIWAIDLDKAGRAIEALSESTKQLERSATAPPDPKDPLSTCQWTQCIDEMATCSGQGLGGPGGDDSCQAECPAGTVESWRTYGIPGCDAQSKYRLFCCPILDRPDSCKIRKDVQKFTTPTCMGRCSGSEVKIGVSVLDCLMGWNEICCTRTNALTAMQQCEWTANCSDGGQCPKGKPNLVTTNAYGDGGMPCTSLNEEKSLCCNDPSPYFDCKWDMGPYGESDCRGTCSAPYSVVVASSIGCSRGQQVLCCTRKEGETTMSYVKDMLWEYLKNPTCPAPAKDIETRNASLVEERDSLFNFPNEDGVRI